MVYILKTYILQKKNGAASPKLTLEFAIQITSEYSDIYIVSVSTFPSPFFNLIIFWAEFSHHCAGAPHFALAEGFKFFFEFFPVVCFRVAVD